MNSAFQINTSSGWQPLKDSRVRKALKSINMTLGLDPSFTYLYFYHATFAHNAHVHILQVKYHGIWSSECVWRYIQSDNVCQGKHWLFLPAAAIDA